MPIIAPIPRTQRRLMQETIHKTKDKNHARRLTAMLMLHRGDTVSYVARTLCCARSSIGRWINWFTLSGVEVNRPGFPGECFICELRLPDHRFRWKHNKLFLLLPEEYGPAFPAIVDCYTSPPT